MPPRDWMLRLRSAVLGFASTLFVCVPIILAPVHVSYAAHTSIDEDVLLQPFDLAVTPSSTLPPETQALEQQTVGALFDRNTNSIYTAYDSSTVDVALERTHEIHGIKVFGNAPNIITVQTDNTGTWETVASIDTVDLASAAANKWNTFDFDVHVTTNKLRFLLSPSATTTTSTGLGEIEVWGHGRRFNTKDGNQLLEAMASAEPPENGRIYTSPLTQGVIGPLTGTAPDDPADNSFDINITRNPMDFRRAYVVYELYGYPEWITPLRGINTHSVQGGFVLPEYAEWTTQIEEINPEWLVRGGNTLHFAVPDGMQTSFTVRDLRIVGELPNGSNFTRDVVSNVIPGINNPDNVNDGDLNSGWQPYPAEIDPGNTKPRILGLRFTQPIHADRLSFYMVNSLDGQFEVEYLDYIDVKKHDEHEKWYPVRETAALIDASTLTVGWNTIAIDVAKPVYGLRLKFTGGTQIAGEIREMYAIGSPRDHRHIRPNINIQYPTKGQFWGREAYVRGYVTPIDNGSGPATLSINHVQIPHTDGAFGIKIHKDEHGYEDHMDHEAWTVRVKATYPDGHWNYIDVPFAIPGQALLRSTNDVLPTYAEMVKPGKFHKFRHDDAELEFDGDELHEDYTITVSPLFGSHLPKLSEGMTNVTKGPRRGYRFLPHGSKFLNKVKVRLPYDRKLIPPGHSPKDIKTYYYDTEAGRWIALEHIHNSFYPRPAGGSDEDDDERGDFIESHTDHFTDMINAIVTVPDHPEGDNFASTQIKDLEAANPSSKINLIDAPDGNSSGDANLSYPIELPAGRQGIQPGLSVNYSSAGGNGWMGMGWNMPMASIAIDTRWGVPRYDGTYETETYTLNGQQLTPVAHRGALKLRADDTTTYNGETVKIFHTRVEGDFQRIIRHGTDPKTYWWEVISKDGMRSFYGGGPNTGGPTTNSTLADADGDIAMWSLRETRDTHDNFIKYTCERVTDVGVANGTVPGTTLYLKSITYTGSGAIEGPYKVEFIRDSELTEPRRRDVQISARNGFKEVTAELLRKVNVTFNNEMVRSYEFTYEEGAFHKKLLTSIKQFGEDGSFFNEHKLAYHDTVRNGAAYAGFGSVEQYNGTKDISTSGMLGRGDASLLGGSVSEAFGGHFYGGFNPSHGSKQGSFGGKVGHNRSKTEGILSLMDINGDGRADKVYNKESGGRFYRPNETVPGGPVTFGEEASLPTLPALSKERSRTTSHGPEIYFGVTVMDNFSRNFTEASTYITDANGDGLPDLASGGQIFFNRLNAQGVPTFAADSNGTPFPISSGQIDSADLLEDLEAIYQENIDTFPLVDTVRRWVAPYSGRISIVGDATLVNTSVEQQNQLYTTADGVKVSIQQNGAVPLWEYTIAADDFDAKTPVGVDDIPVNKGDRIYFRTQSIEDGAFDQVEWTPEITYLSVPVETDVDNRDPYKFNYANDFTLGGLNDIEIEVPVDGTLQIAGAFNKTAATSDNVTIQVIHNGTAVVNQTITADAVTTVPLDQPLTVVQRDKIFFRIKVDSPIDASKIHWAPQLYYTASPNIDRFTDDEGNYLVQLNPAFSMNIYPETNLVAPLQPWTATRTGPLTISPSLGVDPDGTASGQVHVVVKQLGNLVGKRTFTFTNGQGSAGDFIVDVIAGQQYYFQIANPSFEFNAELSGKSLVAVYGDPETDPIINVPFGYYYASETGFFPQAHRGWSVAGYNGNRVLANQPINEGAFAIDPRLRNENTREYNLEDAKAYFYNPEPANSQWRGPDDLAWVQATSHSTSRMGLDNVQVPRNGDFAGRQAVPRISRAKQRVINGGFGPATASVTENKLTNNTGDNSHSELDFIDLNGDQFPDVVSDRRIQYTSMTGGLEPNNRGVTIGKIRQSESWTGNIGIGGNAATFKQNSKGNVGSTADSSGGNSSGGSSQMVTIGFSGSLGVGASMSEFDLMDVNGDGLPDRVSNDRSGNLSVALNIGYNFADPEPWGVVHMNENESVNATLGGSIGYNSGEYAFGGGVNLSADESKTLKSMTDINGDGLLDRISEAGGQLYVGFNLGNGFAADVAWGAGINKEVSQNTSETFGGGAYFTYAIGPLCYFACYVILNPGVDYSKTMSRPEVMLQDIDGDGLYDHLFSEKDNELTYALNTTGITNLLKEVKRPLGATIAIDYERSGNTYDQPSNKYVMSRVEVNDGHTGDGEDVLLATYIYENGRYDRQEREFYGYGRIIEEQREKSNAEAINRSVVSEYHTDNYYSKGLLKRKLSQDAAENPFREERYTYVLRNLGTGQPLVDLSSTTATVFPELSRQDEAFYEGQASAGITTYKGYEYDARGNIIRTFDAGNPGASDDVEAVITYADCNADDAYIVGIANSITVTGNGNVMRHRDSDVDCTNGDVTQVRRHLADSTIAVTDLVYLPDGNILSVTGPANHKAERFALSYEYDPIVSTYTTAVIDSFGYRSERTYNYKYGLSETITDINSNVMTHTFDVFGRLATIVGPYQQGSGQLTINYTYQPYVDLSAPMTNLTLSSAMTQNNDRYRSATDTIDTVNFIDGFRRTVQIKADGTIHTGEITPAQDVVIVSGLREYDHMGREKARHYPTYEPVGSINVFNPGFDDTVDPLTTKYDILDRVVESVTPDGAIVSSSYDIVADREGQMAFRKSTLDANTNRSETLRDVDNQIVTQKEFNRDGNEVIFTSYRYDPLDQLIEVEDNHHNVTKASYDNFGRRTVIESPDMGKSEFVYDLADNKIQHITANLRPIGKAINYDFEFNRLKSITYPIYKRNNISYEYGAIGATDNRIGRVTTIHDAAGTIERFYGKLGEMTKEIRRIHHHHHGHDDEHKHDDRHEHDDEYHVEDVYTSEYVYDTWNRIQKMTYPDGEVLTYKYNAGGMLASIQGEQTVIIWPDDDDKPTIQKSEINDYVQRLEYDKFEDRVFILTGNGVKTSYSYDPRTRRISNLASVRPSTLPMQNLEYNYDQMGNITKLVNNIPFVKSFPYEYGEEYGEHNDHGHDYGHGDDHDGEHEYTKIGSTTQNFKYDDLYRLVHANGEYLSRHHEYDEDDDGKSDHEYGSDDEEHEPGIYKNQYTLDMAYDPIHNITQKIQNNQIVEPDGDVDEVERNTYAWHYSYQGKRPHAPDQIGRRHFLYDNNGNMIAYYTGSEYDDDDENEYGSYRKMVWDEENRLRWVFDGHHYEGEHDGDHEESERNHYVYAHDDQRIIKHKEEEEIVYVNPYFIVKNHGLVTKNIMAGDQRVVSKVRHQHYHYEDDDRHEYKDEDKRLRTHKPYYFYYHSNHIGSTNFVTDKRGEMYQHLEDFPFGETWVDEGHRPSIDYRFTGKELDEETGLMYFGARYYDPRTSVWVSPDPILNSYMDGRPNNGAYDPVNMQLYGYAANNPLRYTDPDGNLLCFGLCVAIGIFIAKEVATAAVEYAYEKATGEELPVCLGLASCGKKIVKKGVKKLAKKTVTKNPKGSPPKGNPSKKSSGCKVGSFSLDTPVLTADGLVAIEQLSIGDTVLTSSDVVEDELLPLNIVGKLSGVHEGDGIVLTVEAETGETEDITTTADHPFYIIDKGWTPASELKDGDLLKTATGFVKLAGATWVQETLITRNLDVDEHDSFYVGKLQVWVHNQSDDCGDGVDLELKAKEGWTKKQVEAAKKKAEALTKADTKVTKKIERKGTEQKKFRKEKNLDKNTDADHTVDLQLGGKDVKENISGLDKSVNRSLGPQIQNKIKKLPEDTKVNKVTIKE